MFHSVTVGQKTVVAFAKVGDIIKDNKTKKCFKMCAAHKCVFVALQRIIIIIIINAKKEGTVELSVSDCVHEVKAPIEKSTSLPTADRSAYL